MTIYGHRYETHITNSTAAGPVGTFTYRFTTVFPGQQPTCDAFSYVHLRRYDELGVRYGRNKKRLKHWRI